MANDKLWYGIPGIKFIYHGDWSDPELKYNGKLYNPYLIENTMLERYKELRHEDESNVIFEDGFEKYMAENAAQVYELLENPY